MTRLPRAKPLSMVLKDVPTLIEVVDKTPYQKRVKRRVVPTTWRKLKAVIGQQLKAGGMVDLECRSVSIPVQKTTRYGRKFAVPGRTIIEVADVILKP